MKHCEVCEGAIDDSMGSSGWGWCQRCQHGTRDIEYADVCDAYLTDEYARHNGDFVFLKQQHQTNVELLQKHINGKQVLDIGFLEGAGMSAMADKGFDVSGFDVSASARAKAIANGISESRLKVSPSFSSTIFGREFDGITCREVIEHVPNPNDLLTNIYTSLRSNGVAQIQTPVFSQSVRFWECQQHLRCYSVGSLIISAERVGLQFIDSLLWSGGMCLTFRKRQL